MTATANYVGHIAVIFSSRRNAHDPEGYAAAAAEMERLVREQPGYCGHESVRGEDGWGITVSYWENEDKAKAWRDHPRHAEVRARGRSQWYDEYHIKVCAVSRAYAWSKNEA